MKNQKENRAQKMVRLEVSIVASFVIAHQKVMIHPILKGEEFPSKNGWTFSHRRSSMKHNYPECGNYHFAAKQDTWKLKWEI